MLCEQCRMREASIVIREVVNGTVTERNLCSECASQSDLGGILMDSSSHLQNFCQESLESAIPDAARRRTHLSCPVRLVG